MNGDTVAIPDYSVHLPCVRRCRRESVCQLAQCDVYSHQKNSLRDGFSTNNPDHSVIFNIYFYVEGNIRGPTSAKGEESVPETFETPVNFCR